MGTYDKLVSPFQNGSKPKYLSRKMVEGFEAAEIILGYPRHSLSIMQGSWNTGVQQSAGTHDKSGVADLTAYEVSRKMWVLRTLGFPGWHRREWEGDWAPHLHAISHDDPGMGSYALVQDDAYLAGYNGLGSRGRAGRDPFPRPAEPSVVFVQGAGKQRWVANRATYGMTSAGGAKKDGTDRAAGWVWPEANIAQVKVGDTAYLVSSSGTFYRKSHFDPYVAPKASTPYYVAGPFAIGHATPTARSARVGGVKAWGTRLAIRKIETVAGAEWGYMTVDGSAGRWYLMANLSKTPPTSPIGKIGDFTVGLYNTAAQATGHSATYPVRAPLSAAHMVEAEADVWGVVEYGSSTSELDGVTYLAISDAALDVASQDRFQRMPHGARARYLLLNKDTVQYVSESGGSWTLPTHVDANGTQITQGAVWKDDMRQHVVVGHLDVNSTATQLKAQARETLESAEVVRARNGARPWNVTIMFDENDAGPYVEQVMAAWGFVPLADDVPLEAAADADKKSYNYWRSEWVLGPRIDNIYVPEGSGVDWHTLLDGVASDHNPQWGTRATYGTPAPTA